MSTEPGGGDAFAQRLASLSPAKRALLELRLKQSSTQPNVTGMPPIVRRGLRSAPLSFAQHRLWFLEQLQPGTPLYNLPCRAWLYGRLKVDALRDALNEIVARHEALRTTFLSMDGEPIQSIAPELVLDLPLIDLTFLPSENRESEVRRLATEQARWPFDLARGPLIRGRLLRLSEEEHALILTLHHIIADGWSVGVLVRELGTLYQDFSEGKPSSLPGLSVQYADYAVAQRDWLQGPVLQRELAYWKTRFPTLPAPLQLPTDRPRPVLQTFSGARVRFTVPVNTTSQLRALALDEGATLFMTLLAAFQVLLARVTEREDIVVGSPIAGRTRPETESLIGFFINTLALRTDLSGDPTFRELLGRVREVALAAYAHQELPFEKLVEELQPERSLSHTPLFQVMFVLQNLPRSERRLGELTLRHLEADKGTAKFDIGLSLNEDAGKLQGVFSYNTDLFDQATIERLAAHYGVLLKAIASDPGPRLSALPILTDEESRLLVEWNSTTREYPRDRCIHQLFEEQAERTPEALAVRFGEQQLTYRELNHRSNLLAHHLRRCGVGPDVRVGLCLNRSLELVVAVLAVLKSGGAYVPLDPAHPGERLTYMLEDAKVTVLMTDLSSSLPPLPSGVALLDLGDQAVATAAVGELPGNGVCPDNLAYVIYTSGSTGLPKGVAIPHRAVVNLSVAAAREYRIGNSDRVLQAASLTSDFSVEEIFPALISGAAVVVRPPGPIPSSTDLGRLLERHGISIMLMPTAFWHGWVHDIQRERLQLPGSLRVVSIGGEKVDPAAFALWRELGNGAVRWFNTYGPTETTVEATLHEPGAAARVPAAGAELPIGRPLPNTRVYVLDRHLQLVPIGVPGELYIAGDGVARGYLDRPGLTAERFIPNPFGPGVGTRLYRTGDQGRYRADGSLEFIGRADHQVKIRGYRVELGEVEAALSVHPGVHECAVLAREDTPGDRRLIAYVVPGDDPVSTGELRNFLQVRLPDYMVPSAFVLLETMPLTPNGKIDRRVLPAPDESRPDLAAVFVGPRTPVEETIAAIWRQLLRVERVGVHDNFFELGGHSLLATQVIARIRAAFEMELELRVLFEAPTVASIAERIEETYRLLEEVASLSPSQAHAELSEPSTAGQLPGSEAHA
jgi:amino acid adenylation domain-containing protein